MMDYSYDGSFMGLMTVIFEIYASKQEPGSIRPEQYVEQDLFKKPYYVPTCERQGGRVWKALRQKLTPLAVRNLYKTLLSEQEQAEYHIYGMIKYAFANMLSIEDDYRNPHVMAVRKWAKKVNREVHRMHAFVRFQKMKGDIYAATIMPDFNVIPLIGNHFEKRFADQKWMIYDTKRNLGLYYDLKDCHIMHLEQAALTKDRKIDPSLLEEGEADMEDLWRVYFCATNIPERKNMKLHLQHLPKRYWRYLPEKGSA